MSWKSSKRWLGPCLLGLTVSAGCSHVTPGNRSAGPLPPPAGMAAAAKVVPAQNGALASQSQTPALPQSRYAAENSPPASPVSNRAPVTAVEAPPVQAAAPPAEPQVTQVHYRDPQQPAPVAQEEPAAAPVQTPTVSVGPAELAAPAAPVAPEPQGAAQGDATAAPGFGHSADYTCLNGQIEYSRLSRGWRLRYASLEEVDRYGGSVSLVENRDLDKLQDGQYVFVQGHLTNPNDSSSAPTFRVDSFKVITNSAPAGQPANPQ